MKKRMYAAATILFALTTQKVNCVARGGFEPPHTGPKPAVLPLDDRAILIY